tara:strand:- start:101 stop:529 length:429 start_codon:yes stop_codon:yes gene_type:complete
MKKLLYALILIVFDQFTKFLFQNQYYGSGFFKIYYTENTGAAFSILQNQNLLLAIIAIVVVALIFYYYKQVKLKLPLILILAGAVGNLIDRVFFGFVRDFISISIWPIFNLADVFSTVGVLWLIYYFYTEEKTYKSKTPRKK